LEVGKTRKEVGETWVFSSGNLGDPEDVACEDGPA
jgi:hypothetical protein